MLCGAVARRHCALAATRRALQVIWFVKCLYSGGRLLELIGDTSRDFQRVAADGIPHGLTHIPWSVSSNVDKLKMFIEAVERLKDEVDSDQVRAEQRRDLCCASAGSPS